MTDDPIVEEVHRIREQMLAEFGGDLGALLREMQRRTEEAAGAGKNVTAPPSRGPTALPASAKKVG